MTDQVAAPVSDPNPDNAEAGLGETVLLDLAGAPKVDEPKAPEVPKVDEPDGGTFTYEPTGDVGLDMALTFVGKAGLSGDHPAMQAAANGDFTILKATLAQKNVPGWEQMVALGEAAYSRTKASEAAAGAALLSLVHEVAGGKEEWGAVQKWAGANATPEEKAQINELLNKGGLAAKGAVKYLVDAYQRAGNVVVEPKDGTGDASRNATVSPDQGPLSPKAYAAEVQKLNNKLNGRLEGSKEYQNLQRRRSAYVG